MKLKEAFGPQIAQISTDLSGACLVTAGRQADCPIYGDASVTDIVPGREWLRKRLRAGRFLHMVWMHLYRREFIELVKVAQ